MLTAAETELICAAVDGEMSPGQAASFSLLIEAKPQAEQLFRALIQDRDAILLLPRVPAPSGLHQGILDRIIPTTPRKTPAATPRRRSLAMALGMAASFLIAVGTASYWFALQNTNSYRVSQSQLLQLPKSGTNLLPPVERSIRVDTSELIADTIDPLETPDFPSVPSIERVVTNPQPAPLPNSPPTAPAEVLAAPVGVDAKPFERHAVKLPILLPFAKLGIPEGREAFRAQLSADVGVRLDLFVKDCPKAIELLTNAGKAAHVNLLTETIANERLKRKMNSTWLIFTDMLNADELTNWMRATADLDKSEPNSSNPTFGTFHLLPTGNAEQKDLQSLIGFDLGSTKKPRSTDVSAHISATTIDQLTQSIQKSEPTKPAILLTYLPPLVRVQPALSRDIKQFHELRKDKKPGTTPVMIVIRQQN
jgi:hypothetical protein